MASLCALGGENVWAESVRGAVGVRCPDLGGKRRPLLGGISSTVVQSVLSVLSAFRMARYERLRSFEKCFSTVLVANGIASKNCCKDLRL